MENVSDFNSLAWNEIESKANDRIFNYLDLNYQLASLYTYYSNQFVNNYNVGANFDRFMWQSMFDRYFGFKAKPIELNSLLNSLNASNFRLVDKHFYLVSNSIIFREKDNRVERIGTSDYLELNKGKKFLKTNFDQITLPIPKYNKEAENWETKEFNDLEEFAKFWFYDNREIILDLNRHFEQKPNLKYSYKFIYLEIFLRLIFRK